MNRKYKGISFISVVVATMLLFSINVFALQDVQADKVPGWTGNGSVSMVNGNRNLNVGENVTLFYSGYTWAGCTNSSRTWWIWWTYPWMFDMVGNSWWGNSSYFSGMYQNFKARDGGTSYAEADYYLANGRYFAYSGYVFNANDFDYHTVSNRLDVTVIQPVTGVSITTTKPTSLTAGSSKYIYGNVLPSGATNYNLTWTSSDPSILQVTSSYSWGAYVKGLKEGSVTLTARSEEGGFTDTIKVDVTAIRVTGISITTAKPQTMTPGTDKYIYCSVTPSNATNKNVIWTSSNTDVLSITSSTNTNAYVKGSKVGTAILTAKTQDGNLVDTITVDVKENFSLVKGTVNSPSGVYVNGNTVTIGGNSAWAKSNSTGSRVGYATYTIVDQGGVGNVTWANTTFTPTSTSWSLSGTVSGVPANGGTHTYKIISTYGQQSFEEGIITINFATIQIAGGTTNKNASVYTEGDTITLSGNRAYAQYSTGTKIADANYSISKVSGNTNITWGSVTYPTQTTWQVQGTVGNVANVENYVLQINKTYGTESVSENITINLFPRITSDTPDVYLGKSVDHSHIVTELSYLNISNGEVSQITLTPEEKEFNSQLVGRETYVNGDLTKNSFAFKVGPNSSLVNETKVRFEFNTTNSADIQVQLTNAKLYKLVNGQMVHLKDISLTNSKISSNVYEIPLGNTLKQEGQATYVLRYIGKIDVSRFENKKVKINNKTTLIFTLPTGTIEEGINDSIRNFDVEINVSKLNIQLQ